MTQNNLNLISISNSFLDLNMKAKQLIGQVEWVVTQRKVEHVEDLFQLQKHKSIQIRRKVAEGIGLLGNKQLAHKLKDWQQQESDRQTWLILRGVIDKLERGLNITLEKNVAILSVSEAINLVKKVLGDQTYIIEGELAEVKLIAPMYYFALKDKQDTRLECSIFQGKINRFDFPLNDGLTVRIRGRFGLNKFSKLKFEVENIELTGEGELLRNLHLLRQKLELEGFFDPGRKRPIPQFPQNILLLASSNSAALTDFVKVVGQRRGGIRIFHLPIKTQGIGAEFDILAKLEQVNNLTEQYNIDTVVLTRGGGSKDDLFVFNSERIIRNLFGINRPTIVAIGHERGLTLSELVADLRASTPSNAAELVSISRQEIWSQIERYLQFFEHYFTRRRQAYLHTSQQILTLIGHHIQERIHRYRLQCKNVNHLIFNYLWQLKQLLSQTDRLKQKLQLSLNNCRIEKNNFYLLIKQKIAQNFQIYQNKFQLLKSQIQLLEPKNILSRGFAIVRQNEQIIISKKNLQTKQSLQLEFFDGTIDCFD